MLHMNQIDEIKQLQLMGYGPHQIAIRLGIDRKTVSKYMGQEDFNSSLEAPKSLPSKLDPWKPTIDCWLEEDRRMRYKQRHTAKRVHERLQKEYADSYRCSYPLVQRYIKGKKAEQDRRQGALELIWSPGESQADFGEAELSEGGQKILIKYLCLSFPYSNAAYVQVFRGETAECVAQGLKDIFHHLGGVPSRIVFDNASGIGRRIRDKVSFAELFLRFKCHYGFSVRFCNPESGHEKGNVENKVGYIRRNFLVPMPEVESIEAWNLQLLEQVEEDFQRLHYKKGRFIAQLLQEDLRQLSPLPAKAFRVERLERVHTDGYGKFCLDGKHWYSSAPEYSHRDLVVGIAAHAVNVYRPDGGLLSTHRRAFGDSRTDNIDAHTSIERLLKHPNAWSNSGLRHSLPEAVRIRLDELPTVELRHVLAILNRSSQQFGYETALESLQEALRRGTVDRYSVQAVAARIAWDGLHAVPAGGPDLQAYDQVLREAKEAHV
jgi:transposase